MSNLGSFDSDFGSSSLAFLPLSFTSPDFSPRDFDLNFDLNFYPGSFDLSFVI
jgi:hypothetical protein